MIAGALNWLWVPVALFIGTVGAASVFKAVHIDRRELFVGGFSATFIGRWMDRFGAAMIMTVGSVLSALALLLCA